MRKTIIAIAILLVGCVGIVKAQSLDSLELRKAAIAQARYLKSIYKTDEAISLLSGLVSPGGFEEDVLAELADCHFQSGDYESAVGTYFILSSKFPRNILYKIRQMQIYSRLKAYPESIMAGRQVLQLDSIPAVMTFIGDSFRQLDRLDSALVYYRKSLSFRPMNEIVVAKAANTMIALEDYDGALSLTGDYLSRDPDNMTVAPVRGLALYRKGDYEEAVKVFQRQEDLGNDSYPVHYYLGQSYWQIKVMYRAEQELIAAWKADSSDVNLAYNIASVKSDAMRPFEKEVKPWLDKAWDMVQPDPQLMFRLHHQYGLGYYKSYNAWDAAIEHYKEAYRYNPKFISALSTIGYCYEMKKDYKKALEWYERYQKVVSPGSKGHDFVLQSIAHVKAKIFMESKP